MSTLYADPAILWERVLDRITINEDGCWIFPGATNSRGYGIVSAGKKGTTILAHRLAVIVRDGSVPEGLTVDHQCHDSRTCDTRTCQHRRCVNPAHLAVMTIGENTARRWESGLCAQGHKLTWRADRNRRECRECQYAKRRTLSGRTSSDYWTAMREKRLTP